MSIRGRDWQKGKQLDHGVDGEVTLHQRRCSRANAVKVVMCESNGKVEGDRNMDNTEWNLLDGSMW